MQTSERTTINMHPERAVPDEREDILNSGLVAHIGFIEDGVPHVIPMTYHYDSERPDKIYIHGGVKSRAMDRMVSGIPLCVTVTITDGLVYSRKALNHSVNYRSAMLFGTAREVTDEAEKYELMDLMVQRYFPDRLIGRDYNAPPSSDLGNHHNCGNANRGLEREGPSRRAHRARRQRSQCPGNCRIH